MKFYLKLFHPLPLLKASGFDAVCLSHLIHLGAKRDDNSVQLILYSY